MRIKFDHVGSFPGGSVIKNSPANAGDKGSIPGSGKSHNPQGKLSPCTTTTEPRCSRSDALQGEATTERSRHTPLTATRGSPCTARETQYSQRQINTFDDVGKTFNTFPGK